MLKLTDEQKRVVDVISKGFDKLREEDSRFFIEIKDGKIFLSDTFRIVYFDIETDLADGQYLYPEMVKPENETTNPRLLQGLVERYSDVKTTECPLKVIFMRNTNENSIDFEFLRDIGSSNTNVTFGMPKDDKAKEPFIITTGDNITWFIMSIEKRADDYNEIRRLEGIK